ncbi:cytochrome P450 [Apodospora peruviana]|uniref:Cytochrome P450 n=1 Tax=Apodospora peruviana TaxID=516989 RepID=A0AAE0M4C0_9PEZI|nr:cytochrome P450 [Apodospora peruviana]
MSTSPSCWVAIRKLYDLILWDILVGGIVATLIAAIYLSGIGIYLFGIGIYLSGIGIYLSGIGIYLSGIGIYLSGIGKTGNGAYQVWDPIPYLYNTYQYTDQQKLLLRAAIQTIFRTGPSATISPDKFMLLIFEYMMGLNKEEMEAPTTRYWAGYHRIIHTYLARTHETNKLGAAYQKFFAEEHLEKKFAVGEWTTVRIKEFLQRDMAEAATVALMRPRLLEFYPDFIDRFWEMVDIAAKLVWGLTKWINPAAWKRRDDMHDAVGKWLDATWADLDWNGPDADADWEPIFGSRFSRELARWVREDTKFSKKSQAGIIFTNPIFGGNANSIPIATWMVMELIKDPATFQSVREEVETALINDPDDPSGKSRIIDTQKMLALPVLQFIYTEALRLHMSTNITREVTSPTVIESHTLEKGAVLQAPLEIVHYDEEIWGADGHPASEFWAERHIKYVDEESADDKTGSPKKAKQFSIAGRTHEPVPYGGGVSTCPGRFFAMLVSRFDVEFVEWTQLDGSPIMPGFVGGAGVPPDRDMKIRWKRLRRLGM